MPSLYILRYASRLYLFTVIQQRLSVLSSNFMNIGTARWVIYEHGDYEGKSITLNPGSYASLPEGISGVVSSAKECESMI